MCLGEGKSVTGDKPSRRVNRTLIRAQACREGVHFSLFPESYGGDSLRIKAKTNCQTGLDKTPTTFSF
jgi:hypothetical protein